MFSSHVDIFQLEKSLQLQTQQLLIPNKTETTQQQQIDILENGGSTTQNSNSNKKGNKTVNCGGLFSKKLSFNNKIPMKTNRTRFGSGVMKKIKNKLNISNIDVNPYEILAVNPSLLKSSDVLAVDRKLLEDHTPLYRRPLYSDEKNLYSWLPDNEQNIIWKGVMRQLRMARKLARIKIDEGQKDIKKIADIGLFPTSMNVIEQCPDNNNRLCLNMVDDRVPGIFFAPKRRQHLQILQILIKN